MIVPSRFSSFVYCAALLTSFSASAALQTPPWAWNQGSFGFSESTEYFQSSANYSDSRGSFERLSGDSNATAWQNEFRGRYAFTPWLSTYAGFGLSSIRVTDLTTQKSNSGLTDVHAGADFNLGTKWVRLIPEIEAGYPLDPSNRSQTVPLTNEGVPWLRASLFAQKPFRFVSVFGHAGFKIPGQGLAKLFLYGLGSEVALGRYFKIGAGLDGYESVLSDDLSATERQRLSTNAMGGSHLFNAYNPALIQAQLWVGLKPVPSMTIRGGYAKTVNGIRAAEGQAFTLSFAYYFTPRHIKEPDTLASRQRKARQNQEKALQTFDVEPEQNDPDLFEPGEQYVPTEKSGTLNDAEKLLEPGR